MGKRGKIQDAFKNGKVVTPGTAVAIFGDGDKYRADHSGLFLGFGSQEQDGVKKDGFYMLNQYPKNAYTGKPAYPHIKFQIFDDSKTFSHNASRYNVIYTPQ